MRGSYEIQLLNTFVRDWKNLPVDIRDAVDRCIDDLGLDPIPVSRRAHSVSPRGVRPKVFTLDVLSNHSYKLSFHIDGNKAVLRRVGTHKQIDRDA
jgi:mRNA-degrading endonuclease RelE of RelBE toxin-antitoxin system